MSRLWIVVILLTILWFKAGDGHTLDTQLARRGNQWRCASASGPGFTSCSSTYLREIGQHVIHHKVQYPISSDVCVTIRDLKLQKHHRRGIKGGRNHRKFRFRALDTSQVDWGHQVHQQHLHLIDTDRGPQFSSRPDHNLRFALWNAQSIRSKDTLLQQYLISAQLDICFITETWIKDHDNAWMDTTDLRQNGYDVKFINRSHK